MCLAVPAVRWCQSLRLAVLRCWTSLAPYRCFTWKGSGSLKAPRLYDCLIFSSSGSNSGWVGWLWLTRARNSWSGKSRISTNTASSSSLRCWNRVAMKRPSRISSSSSPRRVRKRMRRLAVSSNCAINRPVWGRIIVFRYCRYHCFFRLPECLKTQAA